MLRAGWASHPQPARLLDVLVGFEEGAEVHGLAAPEVSVDGPVEGELQRAPVKASAVGQLCSRWERAVAQGGRDAQDGDSGAHSDGGPEGGNACGRFRGRRRGCGVAMAGALSGGAGAVDADDAGLGTWGGLAWCTVA
jgi:hypothetical protein